MDDECRVHVLQSTAELEAFEPSWRRLWHADGRATPFQSAAWLLPWWRHFGGNDLRVVVVVHREEPVALLPWYVQHDPSSGERRLLLLGVGTSDYLDGVFDPRCPPEGAARGLARLCGSDGWDRLIAGQLRQGSPLLGAFGQWPPARVAEFTGEPCARMPAVLIRELPLALRRNFRYYRNRAARLGALELVTADDASCSSMFEVLVRLHAARWSQCGQPGVLADPRVVAWHREALLRLHAEGLLRLCMLVAGDTPLGVLHSLVDPPERGVRTQYLYLSAFSPDHGDLSPGTLLLALAIERAREAGIATIDMLRGHETYKQHWRVAATPTFGVALARRMADSVAAARPGHAAAEP